jgi:hypothetical protein
LWTAFDELVLSLDDEQKKAVAKQCGWWEVFRLIQAEWWPDLYSALIKAGLEVLLARRLRLISLSIPRPPLEVSTGIGRRAGPAVLPAVAHSPSPSSGRSSPRTAAASKMAEAVSGRDLHHCVITGQPLNGGVATIETCHIVAAGPAHRQLRKDDVLRVLRKLAPADKEFVLRHLRDEQTAGYVISCPPHIPHAFHCTPSIC